MKPPTAYGSENEETTFIRRIAAPDRTASNRKQKNRLAVAGATIGFIAASAVVGYTALRDGTNGADELVGGAVPTEQLEARNQAAASSSQFVKKSDMSFYPTFDQLDRNQNSFVSQTELLKYIEAEKDKNLAEIEATDLPREIKDNLIKQVNNNYEADGNCVVSAMGTVRFCLVWRIQRVKKECVD